jgi:hypothetical protein
MSRLARSVATVLFVGSAAVVAMAGCRPVDRSESEEGGRLVATPAPTWEGTYRKVSAESLFRVVPRDSLLKYARALRYDSVEGSGDRQRLMFGSYPNGSFGPLARIQPQVGTYLLDTARLAKGRIIAILVNESADTGYTKLAMTRRDSVYWWVDRRAGHWRSAFIPTSKEARIRLTRTMELTSHAGGYRWKQALARWVWSDEDDGAWATCTAFRCCKITSPELRSAMSEP